MSEERFKPFAQTSTEVSLERIADALEEYNKIVKSRVKTKSPYRK
jgi:hypothetical protein